MKRQTRSIKNNKANKVNTGNKGNQQQQKLSSSPTSINALSIKKQVPSCTNKQFQDKEKDVIISKLIKLKFKSNITLKQINQLIDDKQDILIKNTWKDNDIEETQLQWMRLLQSIEQAKCTNLTLLKNINQSFLSSLTQPFYSQINELCIPHNNITSLEAISFLNAPNLNHLDLDHNKIVSLQSLAKFISIKLHVLRIEHNKIQSINQLSRMNTQRGKNQLFISFKNNHPLFKKDSSINVDDIRQLVKIERGKSINLINGYMYTSTRVNQTNDPFMNKNKLKQALLAKYEEIKYSKKQTH